MSPCGSRYNSVAIRRFPNRSELERKIWRTLLLKEVSSDGGLLVLFQSFYCKARTESEVGCWYYSKARTESEVVVESRQSRQIVRKLCGYFSGKD